MEGRGWEEKDCYRVFRSNLKSFRLSRAPARCTYLGREQMQIRLSCNVCLRSEKKEERNPSCKTGWSENGRRRRRVFGLCELIPKVQTLPASYLGGRDLTKPPCFGFPCIHNGHRDLITPNTEFTFEAGAGWESLLLSTETRQNALMPQRKCLIACSLTDDNW